jgi:hypothetical protein
LPFRRSPGLSLTSTVGLRRRGASPQIRKIRQARGIVHLADLLELVAGKIDARFDRNAQRKSALPSSDPNQWAFGDCAHKPNPKAGWS